jgi:hypothetical protein
VALSVFLIESARLFVSPKMAVLPDHPIFASNEIPRRLCILSVLLVALAVTIVAWGALVWVTISAASCR